MHTLRNEYWLIHSTALCAFRVLYGLNTGYVQIDTFVKCCQALSEMAEAFVVASDTLIYIQTIVKKEGIPLPSLTKMKDLTHDLSASEVSVMQHTIMKFSGQGGQLKKETVMGMMRDVSLENLNPD
jgi:hypothetical protein